MRRPKTVMGVAQHVAGHDDPLGDAGADGRAHVVFVELFDDGGADDACKRPGHGHAQGQRGKEHAVKPRTGILAEWNEFAGHVEDRAVDREGQNEQHAQPERGRRDGRDGKDADGLVGPAVAVKCREHAKDQGNGDADEQPEEGKLERHGECFGDSCAHGCAVGAVIAEVSLGEEIPKERTVTDEEWIVEAVAFAVFLQRLL